MAVSESLEEARSSSRSSGTASGSLPEGGVSLTRKRRARSHEDHPFPKRKREPSVFNTTLRPFGRVAGILHVACFLKESDFPLLTLKKKKPFKKLTQHVCHSTDHKDGCLCLGRPLSPSGPRVLTSHLIQHTTQGCPC